MLMGCLKFWTWGMLYCVVMIYMPSNFPVGLLLMHACWQALLDLWFVTSAFIQW